MQSMQQRQQLHRLTQQTTAECPCTTPGTAHKCQSCGNHNTAAAAAAESNAPHLCQVSACLFKGLVRHVPPLKHTKLLHNRHCHTHLCQVSACLLKSLARHACWSCILQTSSNNASPVPGQCPPPRRPGTACVWAPPSRAAHHPAPAQRRTVLSEQLQPHSRTAHIDESWLICSCHHTRHSRTFTLSATA